MHRKDIYNRGYGRSLVFNRDAQILDVEIALFYFLDSLVITMTASPRSRGIGQKPIVLKWAEDIALVR